jgi:hypothetical protein
MPSRLHKVAPTPSRADEAWLAARRTARELDKVLDGSGPRQVVIDRAAAELRLSTRQIYNLLARYRIDRRVTSLLPGGERTRKKRLRQDIEETIARRCASSGSYWRLRHFLPSWLRNSRILTINCQATAVIGSVRHLLVTLTL